MISAKANKSTTRNALRPADIDTKTSTSPASVHDVGNDFSAPSSPKKNTRSCLQVCCTATKANSRPDHGWNG